MNVRKYIVYAVACFDVALIAMSMVCGFASQVCFYQAAAHTATTQYGWYYMPRTDGLQPGENPEFAFVKNYDVLSMGSPDDKVIYITFDAGYENGNADKILDALKDHQAHGRILSCRPLCQSKS